ncbi:hypothetical protein B0H19DRAFT_1055656 [Mycena capillaripes]|nr:hypothetical protein B0H19DRAFT_1055656 [Mycena capillaripes]
MPTYQNAQLHTKQPLGPEKNSNVSGTEFVRCCVNDSGENGIEPGEDYGAHQAGALKIENIHSKFQAHRVGGWHDMSTASMNHARGECLRTSGPCQSARRERCGGVRVLGDDGDGEERKRRRLNGP